jgi:hypothetical protein
MARWAASFLVVCLSLGAGGPGCAPARPVDDANAGRPTPAAAGGGAVIGHLATPDRIITIHAGGPRFSIETLDGRSIDADLTLEGLQASDPRAASIYRGGIAVPEAPLDARVWPPPGGRPEGIEVRAPEPAAFAER